MCNHFNLNEVLNRSAALLLRTAAERLRCILYICL